MQSPPVVLGTYRAALAAIPGFDKKRMLSDAKPPTNMAQISEVEIRAFVAESEKLVQAWRKMVNQ